jgi:hypothetical protein
LKHYLQLRRFWYRAGVTTSKKRAAKKGNEDVGGGKDKKPVHHINFRSDKQTRDDFRIAAEVLHGLKASAALSQFVRHTIREAKKIDEAAFTNPERRSAVLSKYQKKSESEAVPRKPLKVAPMAGRTYDEGKMKVS